MYNFAKRVSMKELAELLSQIDTKDYALLMELKTYIEKGSYNYNPKCEIPNILAGGSTYELTDEGINYYKFFTYGDDLGGSLQKPDCKVIGQGKVRKFYVRKFGQEYLDFLLGPGVATLTNEFRELRRRDAEEEKRVFEEKKRAFEERQKAREEKRKLL